MRGPGTNTRNKAALLLERFRQILLPEHDVRVEVGKGDREQEIEQPVQEVCRAEGRGKPLRHRAHRTGLRNKVTGQRTRQNEQTLGEDQRNHTGRVDAQRYVGALSANHHHAVAAHRTHPLAVLNRNATLPLLHPHDQDDGRNRDEDEDDEQRRLLPKL